MDSVDKFKSWPDVLYEFVVMVVFIPKTLIRIISKPKWITGYVYSQAAIEDNKKAFGKYSPPILTWIVAGVLPYFAIIHFLIEGYADNTVVQVYRNVSWYSLVTSLAVYLVSLPLSCAFVVHLFKHRSIDKQGFKNSFNIQCYCFAVVQFAYFPALLCYIVDEESVWMLIGAFFMLFSIAWFFWAEYRIINNELNAGILKSILVFIVMYTISLLFIGLSTGLFFMMNMSTIGDIVDVTIGDLVPDSLQTDTIYIDPETH